MKDWINRAVGLLENSLNPVPHELNELDWKEDLSPNKIKLSKHLSAFANYIGGGFLVFGVKNDGVSFVEITRQNAEVIISKLAHIAKDCLSPNVSIDHSIVDYHGTPLLFIYINESLIKPVYLKSGTLEDSFVRNGGLTQQSSRHDIGGLMLNSKTPNFEELHASTFITSQNEIINLLDYRTICSLLNRPMPTDVDEVIGWMIHEKMVEKSNDGLYITNFGALSAAYNLHQFEGISRKTIRLIKYKGNNKLETEKEPSFSKGYAVGFESLIEFVTALLPSSEIIQNALRTTTSIYPQIALRELIANALIHQDFQIRGAGPMIEIFDDRIEISNPGKLHPSKTIDRLIGTTPLSRNENLAAAFRRYNICEERGSGFEKAVAAVELFGLPPLKFEDLNGFFKVTMFSPKTFAELSPAERVEAAYQHSILKHYSSSVMTNFSLRERFKMPEKQRSQISIVIREALAQQKIKPKDPQNASTKFAEYVPFWA